MSTIDRVETESEQFDFLVNVFIFLLCCVDFLLLLFLTAVKIASDVDIGIVREVVKGGQDGALADEPGPFLQEGLDGSLGSEFDCLLAPVKLVEEDLHDPVDINNLIFIDI